MWTVLDQLAPDGDIFISVDSNDYSCDSCNEVCSLPFYNFPLEGISNSIDICSNCYQGGISLHFLSTSFHTKCSFCRRRSRCRWIARIGSSRISLFICYRCSSDKDEKIQKKFIKITSHFGITDRKGLVYLDFSPATRVIPGPPVEEHNLKMWVSLIEDLVYVSDNFGPVKNWYIFDQEYTFLFSLEGEVVYFLFNTYSGQVGAVVSNEQCHARAFVLFNSLEIFEKLRAQWRHDFVQMTHVQYAADFKRADKLHLVYDYPTLLKKYLGYLSPGICTIVKQLYKQSINGRSWGSSLNALSFDLNHFARL